VKTGTPWFGPELKDRLKRLSTHCTSWILRP
jgi:hypothetical protein